MSLAMPDGNPQPVQQGSYQNPQQQAARNQLNSTYQQYLGRDMGDQDWYSQTSGGTQYQQSNVNHAMNNIRNSPEAQAYANRNQQQQAPAPTGPDAGGVTNNGAGYAGPSAPPVPGVPPAYAGPNLQNMMSQAADNAPGINSNFTAQQIRDFQGRQLDIPDYVKTQFSQFSDPRNQQIQGGRDQLLIHALQNPESLSQVWQDQMFEKQKDDANSWAQQMGLQNNQNLVARGHTLGGGVQQAMNQDTQSQLMQQLLAGRRDIATQAATQNFADRLNVLGAAEQGLTGDTSREAQVFQNILAGQGAQAGENQFDAQYGFDSTKALADNERGNYQSYLGGRDLQGQENARQEQFRQAAWALSQNSRQNAQQMALQQFLAGNNADLGWANYGLDADSQFLNFLNG
jgi:hypothetical protein